MTNTKNLNNKKFINNQDSTVTKKHKKISFFSAILLVIGSSIGAGIFLKNAEILRNVQGSIYLSIFSWIISIIGVVAMGLTLSEVSSCNTKNNQGIIGWVKWFNSTFMYKTCKNFMAYVHLPTMFFFMPYYAMMTLQEAFGWQTEWWVSALISLFIMMWFIVVSGLSSKWGNIQNWVITSVKFFPLVFAVLAGIILYSMGHRPIDGPIPWPSEEPDHWQLDHRLFSQLYPALGLVGSIPAIVFSFDGFYASAGIQSEMEKPEKTSSAMTIGLLVVSTLDILISISLLLASTNGKINGIKWFDDHAHWVIMLMEIMISFGIFGIINGVGLYAPRFYEDLIKNDDLPFAATLKNKMVPNYPVIGVSYCAILSLCVFVILTLIGSFAYIDVSRYGDTILTTFDGSVWKGYDIKATTSNPNTLGNLNNLYSFCDLIGNWSSILTFACILIAIIGCLINRKTNKVQVKKSKTFVPAAWVCLTIVGIGLLFVFVSVIANIIIVSGWHNDIGKILDQHTEDMYLYDKPAWIKDLVGAIMTLVVLVFFISSCAIPGYFETKKHKK